MKSLFITVSFIALSIVLSVGFGEIALADLSAGLEAYYPCDRIVNGEAIDETGNGYNGTLFGDTALCEDRNGNLDSAFCFDGSGDYIDIGTSLNFPSWNEYSVSVWFLNDGGGDATRGYGQKIIDKTVWYHDWYLRIYTDPADPTVGSFTWRTYEGSAGGISDTDYDYRDNLWHHAIVNKAGSYGELWVDGNLIGTSDNIKTVNSWGKLLIGYSLSGDGYQRKFWSGKIDDIRIYNRALSEDEIKMLFSLVQNPDNGHWYQLVVVHPGINWYDARDSAAAMEYGGMQGHLATLTSLEEEEFVVGNFPQIVPNYVWLGAADEEESDWKWITGEPWSYTNWDPGHGEPNGGTSENCLDYSNGVDKWNDENCDRQLNFYLVEYEHTYLEAEAERGTLSSPMTVISDANASGGQAISVQPGNKSMSNPPASGHAVYTFNVQTAGTYRIKGSVIAPDSAHDSFWVKMDGESWIKWNGIPLGTSWHTAYVHDYDNDNAVVEYDLSKAAHTVTVAYREGSTKLDTIALELVQ